MVRANVVVALFSSILLQSVNSLRVLEARANPQVIGYEINRRDASPFTAPVANNYDGFFYTINITVGTPPQEVMVAVDTGSENLIINSPNSAWCQGGNCSDYGTYDATASTSSKWFNNKMAISYEITTLNGSWVTDDVTFGGKTISQLTIGSANDTSTSGQNLWGFGYNPFQGEDVPSKDTSLQSIAKSGLTKSASVSFFLNETGSTTGSMLLGGLDTSLYTGPIAALPIVPRNGSYDRVAVNLSSVSVINGDSVITSTSDLPTRVMLDSGNFDIKIPQSVAESIQKAFNVTNQIELASYNFSLCPCTLADNPAVVSFNFDKVNITIPMKSLVVNPPQSVLTSFGVPPGTLPSGVCLFLINYSSASAIVNAGDVYILGGAFYSNAYVVFDQDSQEIALAQANFKAGASNILEIPSGQNALSNIVSSLSASSTTTPTASGTQTQTPSATSTKKGNAMSSRKTSMGWAFVGLAVVALTHVF